MERCRAALESAGPDAGFGVMDEACAHAARDATGSLGCLFDAKRALAADLGKGDALAVRRPARPRLLPP